MNSTETYAGQWSEWGLRGAIVTPDWRGMAAEFEGVHLGLIGMLSTSGIPLDVPGGKTLLEGWVEQTFGCDGHSSTQNQRRWVTVTASRIDESRCVLTGPPRVMVLDGSRQPMPVNFVAPAEGEYAYPVTVGLGAVGQAAITLNGACDPEGRVTFVPR